MERYRFRTSGRALFSKFEPVDVLDFCTADCSVYILLFFHVHRVCSITIQLNKLHEHRGDHARSSDRLGDKADVLIAARNVRFWG
jgi:hypothetical protein